MNITNKRWIRRNRHTNKDLVKAIKQHQRWPSFKIVRRHPITKQYLAIDLRQLQVKSYIEFLRQCGREYMFLELLEGDMKDYFKLQTLDEELIKSVKKLFEDDVIDIDAPIKDEE
jgi:hypothetical protein